MSWEMIRECLWAFVAILNAMQLTGWIFTEAVPKTVKHVRRKLEMDTLSKSVGIFLCVAGGVAVLLFSFAYFVTTLRPTNPVMVDPYGRPLVPYSQPHYQPSPNEEMPNRNPYGPYVRPGSLGEKGDKEAKEETKTK